MLNVLKRFVQEPAAEPIPPEELPGYTLTPESMLHEMLSRLLNTLPPKERHALLVASLSPLFDLPLFADLTQQEVDEADLLLDSLLSFSFLSRDPDGMVSLDPLHRSIFQTLFIEQDRPGYLAANGRIALYWENKRTPRSAQSGTQWHITHLLLAGSQKADPTEVAGISLLLRTYTLLYNRADSYQIESLLTGCESILPALVRLETPWLIYFRDLLSLLWARLAQLQQDWPAVEKRLTPVMSRTDITPELAPYLMRTHGDYLVHIKDFVGAINVYHATLKRIDTEIVQRKLIYHAGREWEVLEAERGAALVGLGDAAYGLAIDSRGDHITRISRRKRGVVGRWLATLFSLPIILYLFGAFGIRVFHPRFWVAVGGEDWLILRLFGSAYKWYQKAAPVLKRYGTPRDLVLLTEKEGHLFLRLGDWRPAIERFERLLREEIAPLSDYHRAVITLGLAEAHLRRGEPGRAFLLLNRTLPVFKRYGDNYQKTRANALIGEAGFQIGRYPEALSALDNSLRGFEGEENWVAATNLVEYLQLMLAKITMSDPMRWRAQNLIDSLLKRAYTVQFIHPGLNRLWISALTVSALYVMILPLLILNMVESIEIESRFSFLPAPLFDFDSSYRPEIGQSIIDSLGVSSFISTEITLLGGLAVLMTLGLGLLWLIVGFLFIRFTPTESIQEERVDRVVTLDLAGISLGSLSQPLETHHRMRWDEVERLVSAGLAFIPKLPIYASSFGILSKDARLVVRAQTNWYSSLRERVFRTVDAPRTFLDRVIVTDSWMFIYIWGVSIQLFYLTAALLDRDRLLVERFDLPYRLIDLYPFSLILLLLPPLSWLVTTRWRHRIVLRPRSFWPWSLLICGVVLTSFQFLTAFRPTLTVPDIYPPIIALVMSLAGGLFVWRAREKGHAVYSLFVRLLVCIGMLGMVGGNSYRLWRDGSAYHYLVVAKSHHRTALEQTDPIQKEGFYRLAGRYYALARFQANRPNDLLGEWSVTHNRFGLPRPQHFVSIQALQGEAVIEAQAGGYTVANQKFNRLLLLVPDPDFQSDLYRWIGTVKENEEWVLRREGYRFDDPLTLEFNSQSAFERALTTDPKQAEIYFYQAVAAHVRGQYTTAFDFYEKALRYSPWAPNPSLLQAQTDIGVAWLRFEAEQFATAMLLFDRAMQLIESLPEDERNRTAVLEAERDAHLGIAYTAYLIGQYNLAERALQMVERLNLDLDLEVNREDVDVMIAFAAIHWRSGIHAVDRTTGQDVCRLEEADLETKREARAHYLTAIDYYEDALRSVEGGELGEKSDRLEDLYRSRAAVHLLLSHCPGEVFDSRVSAGIFSLSQAIALAPENRFYYQLRANYHFIRWENRAQYAGQEPINFESVLNRAWDDAIRALTFDQEDRSSQRLLDRIEQEIVTYYGADALDTRYDNLKRNAIP